MSKSLAIDLIRTDGGTQMRAELDRDVYLDYRDKFLAGVKFPPVDVYHDGSTYWLADGFHRFYGAREAKRGSIDCTVHNGTVRDAILFAVGANQLHGLKRTNADKRNCVLSLLNDETWVKWSDNKIAEMTGVHQTTVSSVRKELMDSISSPAAKAQDEPRVGRDGKKRKPKRAAAKSIPNHGIKVIEDDEPEDEPAEPTRPAKPERAVFVKLRSVFDEMNDGERQTAVVMWNEWLES